LDLFNHLKIVLDGVERIFLSDSTYSSGQFGMFAYVSTVEFDNLVATTETLPPPAPPLIFSDNFDEGDLSGWKRNEGVWSNPGTVAQVDAAGTNAWNIYNASGTDFTYEGDMRLLSGVAAGLSFRTNADGTQGYDVILDRNQGNGGRLKLVKRPYEELGIYDFPINHGQTYHLKIVAQGVDFRVYLDGVERIALSDDTYSSGQFGMFAYVSTAEFDNLVAMTPSPSPAATTTTTTIAYKYDALYRLTSAAYDTGNVFTYTYDAVGNVLTRTQVISGFASTTRYIYDAANQLVQAQVSGDPTTWHYAYDGMGRLTDVTPNGTAPVNGARRYTYSAAGFLLKTELHDGAAYQPQAEMHYNGLGGRVTMTGWKDGLSMTTQYALDLAQNGRVLSANAGGASTFYTYGNNGPLAELTTTWAFYLNDGANTPRQMADAEGIVTLARSYTPWGEVLEQNGAGNFAWGYFGGLMDAATGLVYVGSGQYYDPATGRFLTRANTTGPNPYVPWRGDPLGAALGPVGLVMLLRRRKGKNGKADQVILVLVVLVGVSLGLTACVGGGTVVNPNTPTASPGAPPSSTPTTTTITVAPPKATQPAATATPMPTQLPSSTPICTLTPSPTTPKPLYGADNAVGLATKFYELLRDAKQAWWHNAYPFGLRVVVAIVYNRELAALNRDTNARDSVTEAFARRFWQLCREYGSTATCNQLGSNGSPNIALLHYLGGREVVTGRANETPETIEQKLPQYQYNIAQAYDEADKILNPRMYGYDWQSGELLDRPYEWGNPTNQSDVDLINQARRPNTYTTIAGNEMGVTKVS
jgi:RHS repeat-associated protein